MNCYSQVFSQSAKNIYFKNSNVTMFRFIMRHINDHLPLKKQLVYRLSTSVKLAQFRNVS